MFRYLWKGVIMKRKGLTAVICVLFISVIWLVSCSPKLKLEEETLKVKIEKIHDKVLTVDTHSDTPSRLLGGEWKIGERHEPGQRGSGKIDLPRMVEGGLDAEFFAVFIGQGQRTPEGYASARERATRMLDAIHKMCEDYPDMVELATSPEDAYRLEREGKRAAFIGMENGYPIGKNLSLIKKYYERGVRYITLCHSSDNDICDSSTERRNPEDNGLSDFGREVVAECNRLGIMVDLSHSSDKTFFDVLKVTKAPVIASHSSVRSICDHPRNLTDKMLRALASNGGTIQICFVSSFVKKAKPNPERDKALSQLREKYGSLRTTRDEAQREKIRQEYRTILEKYPVDRATVKDLVDHIDHVVKLIGVDHVGIGTDFDGGGDIKGCDNVSELPNITEELVRRGYSEDEIRKIWGGNIMRVFRKVEQIAEKT
ncbi:MAG: membrane dipeptidase [Candidatus Aminicenantes bacterium]|nr:membrane dipeptidase [Candidatus Aminicenantes bacterium]